MKNNRVIHFEIQADDIERAKKFYEKAFGWEIKKYESKENPTPMDYWMVMTGQGPGIDGGMYVRPKEEAMKIHTFDDTILVDDIDAAIKAVKDNGGTITREKMEMKGIGWFASALDTEGNRFALMQAVGWTPK